MEYTNFVSIRTTEMENSKPRKCPKCNEHKEGDKFYNHLSFYCIPCANEYSRDRRKKITNGEVYIIKKVKNNEWFKYLNSVGVKYCYKCENVKPVEEYTKKNAMVISGLDSNCKKCKKWISIHNENKKKQDTINKIRSTERYKKYNKEIKKKRPGIEKARENMDKFFKKMKKVKTHTYRSHNI